MLRTACYGQNAVLQPYDLPVTQGGQICLYHHLSDIHRQKNIESAGEMGPLAGSQVRELVQSGELTASDSIRNVNSQNWVRIDSVPQLASELGKPKSSPKNKDVDLQDSDSKPRAEFMPVCSHCGSTEVRNRRSLILSGTGRTRFSGTADAKNTATLQAHTTVSMSGTSTSKSDLVLLLENQRAFDSHEIVHDELEKLIRSGKWGTSASVTYNNARYSSIYSASRCQCPRCNPPRSHSPSLVESATKLASGTAEMKAAFQAMPNKEELSGLFRKMKERFKASPKRAIGDLVQYVWVQLKLGNALGAELKGRVDSAIAEMDRIRGYCLCCGASQ